MSDPFPGIWKMQPEKNVYEFGNPPQNGLYTIEAEGDGYKITMQWTTMDGQDMNMTYHAIPDGNQHSADPASGVDSMSMTRMDDKTLDSDAVKNGVQVAYATRILSDDNQMMTVKQSGKTPDGQSFTNTSVYMRQ